MSHKGRQHQLRCVWFFRRKLRGNSSVWRLVLARFWLVGNDIIISLTKITAQFPPEKPYITQLMLVKAEFWHDFDWSEVTSFPWRQTISLKMPDSGKQVIVKSRHPPDYTYLTAPTWLDRPDYTDLTAPTWTVPTWLHRTDYYRRTHEGSKLQRTWLKFRCGKYWNVSFLIVNFVAFWLG